MKGSEQFKAVIQKHLDGLAEKDPLFAETLKKPNKSLDECINYIFGCVKESGCNGFPDEEIYGMAVHYYDEDDIKPGKAASGRVVVNHSVELTEEEIKAAKQKAIDQLTQEEKKKMQSKKPVKKPAKKEELKSHVGSLFS